MHIPIPSKEEMIKSIVIVIDSNMCRTYKVYFKNLCYKDKLSLKEAKEYRKQLVAEHLKSYPYQMLIGWSKSDLRNVVLNTKNPMNTRKVALGILENKVESDAHNNRGPAHGW